MISGGQRKRHETAADYESRMEAYFEQERLAEIAANERYLLSRDKLLSDVDSATCLEDIRIILTRVIERLPE